MPGCNDRTHSTGDRDTGTTSADVLTPLDVGSRTDTIGEDTRVDRGAEVGDMGSDADRGPSDADESTDLDASEDGAEMSLDSSGDLDTDLGDASAPDASG